MIEFQRHKPIDSGLQIAPLLDIIFLLLLFFLLTSVFLDPGIPVNLAESTIAELQQDTLNVVITLSKSGELFVQHEAVTFEELPAKLNSLFHVHPDHDVTLKVDKETPFRLFIRLMDSVKQVGGDDLILSAEISG